MANKFDLQIAVATLKNGAVDIGSAVPKGKTRFVCFIKHSVNQAATITIGEAAATETVGDVKDTTVFGAAANMAYPDKIDVDNPLMSIAAEKYLTVGSGGVFGTTTVVYFDE